jgi:DNA-binding GntR family transcriptional regulator
MVIYLSDITNLSLSEQAFQEIRRMIVTLELAPGAVVRDDLLQQQLGLGRTPIREALQRLVRDQFVTIVPRRGMYVSGIDVSELSTLYETRAILEPYVMRLASARGRAADWDAMAAALARTAADSSPTQLLEIDRECREIVWSAAGNRFLTDTLDMLYAQSDRLWHLYLSDVADLGHMIDEHRAIHAALVDGDGERAASLIESHMHAFNAQIVDAVRRRLESPLAGC